MSGQVIKQVVHPHSCYPGWRWKPITKDSGIPPLVPGGEGGCYGIPPTTWEFPKGTVWRCDCGMVWVSEGDDPWSLGPGWRKERRMERWLRERREAR